MKINLTLETTMGEMQTAFSTFFPNLKLAFFSKPHRAFKSSAAKFMVQEKDLPLSRLTAAIEAPVDFLLTKNMTVVALEQELENRFGLHVQVFRRSGKLWLETSQTDNLSLEQQEQKALESDNIHTEFADPLDYRELD